MTTIAIHYDEDSDMVVKIIEYIKDELTKANFDHLEFMDCPEYTNFKKYYRKLYISDYYGASPWCMRKMKKKDILKILKIIKEVQMELAELYDIMFLYKVSSQLIIPLDLLSK